MARKREEIPTQEMATEHKPTEHTMPTDRPGTVPTGGMPQQMVQCPMCGMEFTSREELEQHKKQVHPEK